MVRNWGLAASVLSGAVGLFIGLSGARPRFTIAAASATGFLIQLGMLLFCFRLALADLHSSGIAAGVLKLIFSVLSLSMSGYSPLWLPFFLFLLCVGTKKFHNDWSVGKGLLFIGVLFAVPISVHMLRSDVMSNF